MADVYVEGNTITVGDTGPSGYLHIAVTGQGVVELTGNDLTFRSNAVISAPILAGGTLLVDGNSFTNTDATTGVVTISGVGGSCSVTNNTFELVDPLDLTAQGVGSACSAPVAGHAFTVSSNVVTASGSAASGFSVLGMGHDRVTVNGNQLNIESTLMISSSSPDTVVTGNTVTMGPGSAVLTGNATAKFDVSGNTVTQRTPIGAGLHLSSMASASVTDNRFTGVGVPGVNATALAVQTGSGPMEVTVTDNTFRNYSNALHLTDAAVAAHGYTAVISDNVFDFVIDATPKAATLTNVKDVIDGRHNQWGSNTEVATVEDFVTITNDAGGKILLDPITQP